MKNYYRASTTASSGFPKLQDNIKADICVVGAGFAGLSCALSLAQQGYQVVVLEADSLGHGASGRNAGMLLPSMELPTDMEAMLSPDIIREMLALATEGERLVKQYIDQYEIACDLNEGNLHVATTPRQMKRMEASIARLKTMYGMDRLQVSSADEVANMVGSDCYTGGIYDPAAISLHPLKFLTGLGGCLVNSGVRIFEESAVHTIRDSPMLTAITSEGAVSADKIVLASNVALAQFDSRLARKLLVGYAEIIVTEPLSSEQLDKVLPGKVSVLEARALANYYHLTADNRLLFGGGVSPLFPAEQKKYRYQLQRRLASVFPQLAELRAEYAWLGRIGMTLTGPPLIGEINKDLFYVMANGVLPSLQIGRLLAGAVGGDREKFDYFARLKLQSLPTSPLVRNTLMRSMTVALRAKDWLHG